MNSKEECLKLAILEYEKETIDDENNQWVKNILKELKLIEQDLDRLEQLEKENQELKKKLDSIPPEFDGYLYFAKSISNVVKENTKLKIAIDLIKDYLTIANDVPLMTFAERCFTEQEVELLKEVLEDDR